MKIVEQVAKILAPVALFGMWFALVLMEYTDPQPFVNALMVAIGGGGVHAISQANRK